MYNKEKSRQYYLLNKKKREEYYISNKEKIKEKEQEYRTLNKIKINERRKRHRLKNIEEYNERDRQYILQNKDKIRKRDKQKYQENKEEIKRQRKQYFSENKEICKATQKRSRLKNKAYMKKYNKMYCKRRRLSDPLYKLTGDIRCIILGCFKGLGFKKTKGTNKILGCSFKEFKIHLEKQFNEHMSWNNHGSYWEFDHIKPISLATSEAEVIALNHYTNLRPLEKSLNRAKSNHYPYHI